MHDTADVIQRLGALLVLGVAGYPAGRGKVEKFNQTALAAVLRTLDGNEDVDPDCGALELRLGHWLHEIYNHTPHEALGRASPADAWSCTTRSSTTRSGWPTRASWFASIATRTR
jgi:transposase InsO family protein